MSLAPNQTQTWPRLRSAALPAFGRANTVRFRAINFNQGQFWLSSVFDVSQPCKTFAGGSGRRSFPIPSFGLSLPWGRIAGRGALPLLSKTWPVSAFHGAPGHLFQIAFHIAQSVFQTFTERYPNHFSSVLSSTVSTACPNANEKELTHGTGSFVGATKTYD